MNRLLILKDEVRQRHIIILYLVKIEGQTIVHRPCRAVLERLYLIATWPVRQALNMETVIWSDQLVQYSCRLLARVVAELISQVCSAEVRSSMFSRVTQ